MPAQQQAVNVVRNIMTTVFTKILLYTFIIFALSARLIFLFSFYYSQHDTLVSIGIIVGIIALLFGLTFLICSIFKGLKKNLKSLLIFAAILLIVFLFPFEYIFGWTLYQFNRADRNELLSNLKLGNYDSLIINDKYSEYGTWIDKNPRIKIFKDASLQMIFITHGDISSYDYYGTLFISDPSKMNDKRVWNFIYSEYNKKYLGNNWYLIECYTDTTPGP